MLQSSSIILSKGFDYLILLIDDLILVTPTKIVTLVIKNVGVVTKFAVVVIKNVGVVTKFAHEQVRQ